MGVNDKVGNGEANKRARQKSGRRGRAANVGSVEWTKFGWYAFISLTEALCRHGGAVRLGQTRDGGAYALGIYLGDDYATEYVRQTEDFELAILEIVEAWIPEELDAYTLRLAQLNG